MANVGDIVFYNEGDEVTDSWCVAQVAMTSTVPSSATIATLSGYFGGYPTQPPSGQVLLTYQSMAGNGAPVPATAYASLGTGPREYTTAIPGGW